MSDREIRLTPDELEIIKDEVRFRENVTLRLKSVERKVDDKLINRRDYDNRILFRD